MLLIERGGLAALVVRMAMSGAQALRSTYFAVTTPRTRGARAICLDPSGHVILVRQSYTRGWFLPGGAIKAGEEVEAGLIRELREEIGLRSYSHVETLFEFEHRPSHKRDTQSIAVLRDVEVSPCLSLEIEAIGSFPLTELPSGTHSSTQYKVERAISILTDDGRDWTAIPAPAEI